MYCCKYGGRDDDHDDDDIVPLRVVRVLPTLHRHLAHLTPRENPQLGIDQLDPALVLHPVLVLIAIQAPVREVEIPLLPSSRRCADFELPCTTTTVTTTRSRAAARHVFSSSLDHQRAFLHPRLHRPLSKTLGQGSSPTIALGDGRRSHAEDALRGFDLKLVSVAAFGPGFRLIPAQLEDIDGEVHRALEALEALVFKVG